MQKSIDKETIVKAIEFLDNIPMQRLDFVPFGGEPLLEWELLQFTTAQIQKYCEAKGIKLVNSVTTNGILLTEDRVKWLKNNHYYVVVSIDGNEKMHNTHRLLSSKEGSFNATLKGLKELQKEYEDGEYTVNVVVTSENFYHLKESVKFLYEELGIKKIHLAIDYFSNWQDKAEEFKAIYIELVDYITKLYQDGKRIDINLIDEKITLKIENKCISCSFGEFKMAISPNGTIYPCEKLIGNDNGVLSMGNVFSGFDMSKRTEILSTRGNKTKECQDCAIKDRCFNNCGCTNYGLTGSINQTNGVLCFFQKLFVEMADKMASKLQKEKNKLFLEKFYT